MKIHNSNKLMAFNTNQSVYTYTYKWQKNTSNSRCKQGPTAILRKKGISKNNERMWILQQRQRQKEKLHLHPD